MKTIYKGNNFSIVWNIINRSTQQPFNFTGLDVEIGIYSDSCKTVLQSYGINAGTITAQIEANTLPAGVYSIMCRYSNDAQQAYCNYRNAFQISCRPQAGQDEETVMLTSLAAQIEAESPELEHECELTAEELFGERLSLPELTADRAIADEHGNRIADTYETRQAVRNHIRAVYNEQFIENPPLIMDGYITPGMLSEGVKDMLSQAGATITNVPDGEDLTTKQGVLKLSDKPYNPGAYSGLGRIYLRKNLVGGQNLLTQTMVSKPNTIYILQYDYTLDGKSITIPEGCVLSYEGGSIRDGHINYTDTLIHGTDRISNVTTSGACSHAALPTDEEDITGANGKNLKFKDKEYAPQDYSGLGRIYLRKNIKTVYSEAAQSNVTINLLEQSMIDKPNTIYIIQYDYDLNGSEITIPEGCTLDFQGGSLNNGRIILSNTTIQSNCTNYIFNCELVGSTNSVLSPFMFGFKEGADNSYSVIYRTHVTANRLNTTISYIGINRVNIVIDNNSFMSIPLTGRDDFNNAEFHVTRSYKSENYNPYYLFTLDGSKDIIDNNITVAQISDSSYSLENNKQYTLFVKDKVLWTNRYLSSSGHDRYREDCICIRNNKAINTTCDKYKSTDLVECTLIEDKPYIRFLKNLTIIREESVDICSPIKIEYVSNMEISNVTLNTIKTSNTPKNGDSVFILFHSAFVTFRNVHINNAYSVTDSGHGYELDTCYHIVFDNITGYDDYWGIFASNNVNDITIYNSNINRFDVHCYGRDIKFYNCTFGGVRANQISNMYGVVSFENCIFLWQTRPVLIEPSYNAYTYFDLVFKNCQFYCSSIITIQGIYKEINPRPELSDKYLPSVYMDNIFYYDTDRFVLFDIINSTDLTIENEYKGIKGIYNISINNFIDKAQYPHSYSIINKNVTLLNTTKLSFNNCDFAQVRNYKEITNETYYPTISFVGFKPIVNGSRVAFNLCNIAYDSIVNSAFDYSYENSNIIGYTGADSLDKVSYVKYRNCQIVLKNVQSTPILVNSSYDNCIFMRHKANQVITFNKQGHYRFKDCHVDAITPYEDGYIRAFINDMALNINNAETNESKIDLIKNELTDLFVEKTSDSIYYRSNYSFIATSESYSPFEYITSKKGVPVMHYEGTTYKLSLEEM